MPYRVARSPLPSRKKYYIMGIPDTHVGYSVDTPTYSIPAWDIAMQALYYNQERLTHLVIIGDFGDFPSLSHWASLRAEQAFVMEDIALVNARLDEIEAITKPNGIKVIYIEGNHEAWASQFESKYPESRDMVNLPRQFRLRARGWTWVPENYFWAIGDLHWTHGHLRGVTTPASMVRKTGVSVMYGHVHAYLTQSVRMITGEHAAWAIGCLASIDPPPPYARGLPPDSWVHGFPLVQVRANGRFQVSYRRIVDESWTELEDGTELIADRAAVQERYDQDQQIRDAIRKEYGERFYHPGGQIIRTEPHQGKVDKKGNVSPVARTRRARIVRMQK